MSHQPQQRHRRRLDGTALTAAAATVREQFDGPVTYAAGPWEQVDWAGLDIVAVDLYRDAANAATFRDTLPPTCAMANPAGYLTGLLDVFRDEGVSTAFAFTFASYSYPHHVEPRHDLDLAAYGLVTCYLDRLGTTYPDMPWEPS